MEAASDKRSKQPNFSALSQREQQVITHIADGLTHDQIARLLGITRNTVDTYVKRIKSKIGLGNKAELTQFALREIHLNNYRASDLPRVASD